MTAESMYSIFVLTRSHGRHVARFEPFQIRVDQLLESKARK